MFADNIKVSRCQSATHRTICAALLLVAGSARAAGHSLEVRVSDGTALFAQTVPLELGRDHKFAGTVTGLKNALRRHMIFNTFMIASRSQPGAFSLQYELELANGRVPEFQGQGLLGVLPGTEVTVIECGAWTVEFRLDAATAQGKKGTRPANRAGLGNYLLTAEVVRGSAAHRCRQVSELNTQNYVRAVYGKDNSFFLNSQLVASRRAGILDLQYQLAHAAPGTGPLQIDPPNPLALTLGRQTTAAGPGYRLTLLVQSAAPDAESGHPSAETNESPIYMKKVPLLR